MKKPEFIVYSTIDKDEQIEIAKQCKLVSNEEVDIDLPEKTFMLQPPEGWELIPKKALRKNHNAYLINRVNTEDYLLIVCDFDSGTIHFVQQAFPSDDSRTDLHDTIESYVHAFNEQMTMYKRAYEILSAETIAIIAVDFAAVGYFEIEPNVFYNCDEHKYIVRSEQDGNISYKQAWSVVKLSAHTVLFTDRANINTVGLENAQAADDIMGKIQFRSAFNIVGELEDLK